MDFFKLSMFALVTASSSAFYFLIVVSAALKLVATVPVS